MTESGRRRWMIAVVLAAGAAVMATACGARVGVVDSRRILNESVLALSLQRQLDNQEKLMLEDLRLLTGQLSREDLEARRKTHLAELEALKRDMERRLNNAIRKSVAEVARQHRFRIVLVKEVTPLGGIDVTEEVIDRLKSPGGAQR